MKWIYSSDLHGDVPLYQQLQELGLASSANILILGGDLLPSFPPSRQYEDMIPYQKTFIDQFLLPFFNTLIRTTSIESIFLIPGNWDLGYPYLFSKPAGDVFDLDRKRFRFESGTELIGYPFVPPTPFRPKDFEKRDDAESPWPPQKNPSYIWDPGGAGEIISVDPCLFLRNRGTIQEDLDRLPKPLYLRKAVYVMHSPPFGTGLDVIQGKKFTGSRSMRSFIEEYQPLATLHGHIHEAPEISGIYVDTIGETLCINPGQFSLSEREPHRLHAVTFEVENIEGTLKHSCFERGRMRCGL
jgi:Icc-related predicted phosphoesterase